MLPSHFLNEGLPFQFALGPRMVQLTLQQDTNRSLFAGGLVKGNTAVSQCNCTRARPRAKSSHAGPVAGEARAIWGPISKPGERSGHAGSMAEAHT